MVQLACRSRNNLGTLESEHLCWRAWRNNNKLTPEFVMKVLEGNMPLLTRKKR